MSHRLRPGKVPWEFVAEHLPAELPPEVVLGPSAGEDAALIRIGGELWAVASDPVSLAAADAGRLAVTVNANDVAVRGARPTFFTAVILVAASEDSPDAVGALLQQVSDACNQMGVTLIGGHTEIAPGVDRSLVVGTMLGPVVDRPITTGGLSEGDLVAVTRSAGLEGTAILLDEFGDRLDAPVGDDIDALRSGEWLNVVGEALAAAAVPEVTALHDVTEGGVGEALYELGRAAGVALEIEAARIPVRPDTSHICGVLGIDPLGLIGSGSLLVGCRPAGREGLEIALADLRVPMTWIGRAGRDRRAGASTVPRFERDELLKAYAVSGLEAVVFDMDGTLVESVYDWPKIRRRLGVTGGSIIDALNGLPDPERARRWAELEEIERRATDDASLREHAPELLSLLTERGMRSALVTNNSEENARRILDRFGIEFDVVLSRDSGLWKPSGAPLAEAARRLGVPPQRCLVVGDSSYDALAGRDAGCGAVCLVHEGARSYQGDVDLRFADLVGLARYLRVVL